MDVGYHLEVMNQFYSNLLPLQLQLEQYGTIFIDLDLHSNSVVQRSQNMRGLTVKGCLVIVTATVDCLSTGHSCCYFDICSQNYEIVCLLNSMW